MLPAAVRSSAPPNSVFPPTMIVTMPNMIATRARIAAQRGRRRSPWPWLWIGRVIGLPSRDDYERGRIAGERDDRYRAAESAQFNAFEEIGRDAQQHRKVQNDKRPINSGAVPYTQSRHRGQDDGCVTENHRQDEADRDGMDGGIVGECGCARRSDQEHKTGEPEPKIPCKQAAEKRACPVRRIVRNAMSCLTSHTVSASSPRPLNGAASPANSPRIAPIMISAAASIKVSWLDRGGDNKRRSSSRSAAMVRTRNASPHSATSAAGAPLIRTTVPPTQHADATVRTTVNSAGCRTATVPELTVRAMPCLLYTSDAAD